MKKFNIAIGMSGGIDSSVAALLLKREGHNVVGITFKLWNNASRCCDIKDIANAKKIAYKIGIPHYVIDLQKEFKKSVVDYFIIEYLNGKTPNPCVVCNAKIKFPYLFQKLRLLNFDYIATGHYAKILKKKNQYFLSKAKDKKKSQEYFLARLEKDLLKKIIFPLAELTKDEVRSIANSNEINLRNDESQEVCFIKPGEKYYNFIIENLKKRRADFSGYIIDKNFKILNKHNCYFKYTIGQREGLGISDKTPFYVIKIDPKSKNVMVGKKEDIKRNSMIVKDLYIYKKIDKKSFKANVKIRYNHKESPAEISILDDEKAEINFETFQNAITPGQLAVFYENEIVIGSGWIES